MIYSYDGVLLGSRDRVRKARRFGKRCSVIQHRYLYRYAIRSTVGGERERKRKKIIFINAFCKASTSYYRSSIEYHCRQSDIIRVIIPPFLSLPLGRFRV